MRQIGPTRINRWLWVMLALLVAGILLAHLRLQSQTFTPEDTGMGRCPMDQHWHDSDSSCHRDSDDSVAVPLPKPEKTT